MNNMFLLLLILIIPIGIFLFWKKRKKRKEEGEKVVSGKQRKLDSEAWVTIKKYLKDQNETGKEIIELFVVKKPDENDTNSYATKELKKKQKKELKAKKKLEKIEKKQDPVAYKQKKKSERLTKKPPEHWFLYFITRNAKTKAVDEPRLIEAIISYKRINRKQSDRVINVNPLVDFEKEWEWIKPIKEKEDKQKEKNQAAALKKQAKEKKKAEKKVDKKQNNEKK